MGIPQSFFHLSPPLTNTFPVYNLLSVSDIFTPPALFRGYALTAREAAKYPGSLSSRGMANGELVARYLQHGGRQGSNPVFV